MRRSLFPILITGVLCAAMWIMYPKEVQQTVKTVTPKLGDIIYSVNASGRIEQIRAASLYSSEYATVEKIYVNAGDTVKKGQVLMSLKESDFAVPDQKDMSELLTEVFAHAIAEELNTPSYSTKGQIVSPIDGIVTELNVKELAPVTPVTKCAVVSDVSRMQAIVSVTESDISQVKKGMPVTMSGESFSGIYNGVVLEISQQIKSTISIQGEGDRYAEVVIEVLDADRNLLPGCSVIAKINTRKKENVITLPYEAVTQDQANREVVYIVRNGVVKKNTVTTGYELSNLVEIKSGISDGDEVILSPSEDLAEGDHVVVRN